jgi:magnesium transporter
MLRTFPTHHAQSVLSQCTWIDLVDPSEEERARVEKTFGLHVPTRDDLGEIEASSRLQVEDGTLYMTAPLILSQPNEVWIPTPAGFVLAKHVLLTVRYVPSLFFDNVVKEISGHETLEPALAFVHILEELVDHAADLLEGSGVDLDEAPAHDPHRPHQRADGAHPLHAGLSRPHG